MPKTNNEKLTWAKEKWRRDGMDFGAGGESSMRSNSHTYNEGTLAKQLIHEELNSAMNWQNIVRMFKEGRARDIGDEPKKDKEPCFILGSGPTLDHSIKYLKDWKGGIICTSSHALTLMRYGIEPTHILALDPFCTWDEIDGVDWSRTRTKLIAHPGIWPDLIERWPNDILMYTENMGRPDSYYATTQKHMYTWREIKEGHTIRNPIFNFYIKTEMTLFACSPPMQMFVADLLGYGTIFLAGVDFGFTAEKERFTDYTIDKEKSTDEMKVWIEHKHPFVKSERTIVSNNKVFTEEIHVYYKKNFLSGWRLSRQTVYTTGTGIMPEVPYADIAQVVRRQGEGFKKQTPEWIAHTTEKYLAGVGAFVIESEKGLSFVESNNPGVELLQFMVTLNSQYRCEGCGQNLTSQGSAEDSEGKPCPKCGKALHHVSKIDIMAQMMKIGKLLEENGLSFNVPAHPVPVKPEGLKIIEDARKSESNPGGLHIVK